MIARTRSVTSPGSSWRISALSSSSSCSTISASTSGARSASGGPRLSSSPLTTGPARVPAGRVRLETGVDDAIKQATSPGTSRPNQLVTSVQNAVCSRRSVLLGAEQVNSPGTSVGPHYPRLSLRSSRGQRQNYSIHQNPPQKCSTYLKRRF